MIEFEDIKKAFIKYFEGIYSSQSPSASEIEAMVGSVNTRVTDQMNEELGQKFEVAEV